MSPREVSAAAAAGLTLSPGGCHVILHHQTYPGAYVNSVAYAQFLRRTPRCGASPAR